ncbi:hypothetical protein [Flindersiella endophytica]
MLVRLRIVPAHHDDRAMVDAQLKLVQASGADYDCATQDWRLVVRPEALTGARLDPLFQAAREYGTEVSVLEG